jgi:hypothetical protein
MFYGRHVHKEQRTNHSESHNETKYGRRLFINFYAVCILFPNDIDLRGLRNHRGGWGILWRLLLGLLTLCFRWFGLLEEISD